MEKDRKYSSNSLLSRFERFVRRGRIGVHNNKIALLREKRRKFEAILGFFSRLSESDKEQQTPKTVKYLLPFADEFAFFFIHDDDKYDIEKKIFFSRTSEKKSF